MRRLTSTLFGFLLLGLQACGGDSGGADSSAGILDAPTPEPVSGTPPDEASAPPAPAVEAPPSSTAAAEPLKVVAEASLEPLDSDHDGLPDAVDAYPDSRPVPAEPGGTPILRITGVYTELDAGRLPSVALSGRFLHLEGEGLDARGEAPWLVFETTAGPRAERPVLGEDGRWKILPPPWTVSVRAIVGNRRTADWPLEYLGASAPLLLAVDEIVMAGDVLELRGRNLDAITRVTLGSTTVPVLAAEAGLLRLRLPEQTDGYTLRAYETDRRSNSILLDVRRNVTVSLGEDLASLARGALRTPRADQQSGPSAISAVRLRLPAYGTNVLRFDLTTLVGSFYGGAGAVLWPGDTAVAVSLRSSLEAFAYETRLPRALTDDERRAWLNSVLASAEADGWLEAQARYLGTGEPYEPTTLLDDLLASVSVTDRPEAGETASVSKTLSLSEPAFSPFGTGFGVTNGQLDEPIVFTITTLGGVKPDVPVNEYAQIRLTEHTTPFVPFLSGCDTGNQPLPGGIWPSDLCLNNANPHYASIAVYQPDRFTVGRGYTPTELDQVRSHTTGPFDPKLVIGGGTYLTTDSGRPLCRMKTCYVEILTSGLADAALGVEVTARDAATITVLRKRWLLTEVVVPLFVQLAGLPSGLDTESNDPALKKAAICLADQVYKDPNFVKAIGDLTVGIEQIPVSFENDVDRYLLLFGETFDRTLGSYLIDRLSGTSGNAQDLFKCVEDFRLPSAIAAAVTQKLSLLPRLARDANVVFKVYDLIKNVQEVGGLLLTPEKVLFQVSYRAEITGISPASLDLAELSTPSAPANLMIDGTWIIDDGVTLSSGPILPVVVFKDTAGREKKFRTTVTNFENTGDFVERRLVLPFLELGFREGQGEFLPEFRGGLDELRDGPLELRLEIDYGGHLGYPGDLLQVLSPGRVTLAGEPKLRSFDPQGGAPGVTIKGRGSRLERFSAPVLRFLPLDADVDDVDRAVGSPAQGRLSSGQVLFSVPADVPPGRYRLRLSEAAEGAGGEDLAVLSRSQFEVGVAELFSVAFTDYGPNEDDELFLELRDDAFQSLPNFRAQLPDPDGNRISNLVWGASTGARYLEVECVNPGSDGSCTFGVEARNVRLLKLEGGLPSGEPSTAVGGQLLPEQVETFEIQAP